MIRDISRRALVGAETHVNMPSTENTTLDRIQREIMDVIEREKELRNLYSNGNNITNNSNNNNNNVNGDGGGEEVKKNGSEQVGNGHAPSASSNPVEQQKPVLGVRRFAQNGNAKGVMQKFIRSRGKLGIMNTFKQHASKSFSAPLSHSLTMTSTSSHDFSPLKVTTDSSKRIRNGYVPIEERMRKEIQEAHSREQELRTMRRKSNPDFAALIDLDMMEQPKMGALRATKSMAQLNASTETLDEPFPTSTTTNSTTTLKSAKSLAELCDADEEDIIRPQSLIMQFEQMIIKNQQART